MAFNTGIVPVSQQLTLDCDRSGVTIDKTNFVLTVYLGSSTGLNTYNAKWLFDLLGKDNAKKMAVVLEGSECKVEIEHWMLGKITGPSYPPAHSATYVKSTSEQQAGYEPFRATDPARSRTGGSFNNSWSSGTGNNGLQKINIDYGSALVAAGILLDNYHESGAQTDRGVKTFRVYGSNDASVIDDTTYASLTNLTQIKGTFEAAAHSAFDSADNQFFRFENHNEAYRYYVIRIEDNHGHANNVGLRHVEIIGREDPVDEAILHVLLPTYRDAGDPTPTELTLYADPGQADNEEYIGFINESVAGAGTSVWSNSAHDSNAGFNTFNIRQRISASELSAAVGDTIQLAMRRIATDVTYDEVWVGHRGAGNLWNFDGNQVQITFDGLASATITSDGQLSDAVPFVYDETKDLIVSMNCTSNVPRKASISGYAYYFKNSFVDVATTAPTGYNSVGSSLSGVSGVLIGGEYSPGQDVWAPDYRLVVHPVGSLGINDDTILDSVSGLSFFNGGSLANHVDLISGGRGWSFDGAGYLFRQLSVTQNYGTLSVVLHGTMTGAVGVIGGGSGDNCYNIVAESSTTAYGRILSSNSANLTYSNFLALDFSDGGYDLHNGQGQSVSDTNAGAVLWDTFNVGRPNGFNHYEGTMGDVRLTREGVNRDSEWIALERLSMTDQLITFSGPIFLTPDDTNHEVVSDEAFLDSGFVAPDPAWHEVTSQTPNIIDFVLTVDSAKHQIWSNRPWVDVTEIPSLAGNLAIASLGIAFRCDNIYGNLGIATLGIDGKISVEQDISGSLTIPTLSLAANITVSRVINGELGIAPFGLQGTLSVSTSLSGELGIAPFGLDGTLGENITVTGSFDIPSIGLRGAINEGLSEEILLSHSRRNVNWEPFA